LVLGDVLVVGVGDLELDVLDNAEDDDALVAVVAVFLVAPTEVVGLPEDGDVLETVRLGPEEERPADGELEPVFRLPVTERVADLV